MTPRERRILARYGLTPEDYRHLFFFQAGRCAVCGRLLEEGNVVVDHDHKEHRVRGLLDRYCNKFVVGRHRVGLNGVALLQAASQYLAAPPAQTAGVAVFMPAKKRKSTKVRKAA